VPEKHARISNRPRGAYQVEGTIGQYRYLVGGKPASTWSKTVEDGSA